MATIKRKTQNKTIRKKSLKQTGGKKCGKTLRKKMIGGSDGGGSGSGRRGSGKRNRDDGRKQKTMRGGFPRPRRMPKSFSPGGIPATAAAQQAPVKIQEPVKIQAPQPQPKVSQVSQINAKAAVAQAIGRRGQPKRGPSGAYRRS